MPSCDLGSKDHPWFILRGVVIGVNAFEYPGSLGRQYHDRLLPTSFPEAPFLQSFDNHEIKKKKKMSNMAMLWSCIRFHLHPNLKKTVYVY